VAASRTTASRRARRRRRGRGRPRGEERDGDAGDERAAGEDDLDEDRIEGVGGGDELLILRQELRPQRAQRRGDRRDGAAGDGRERDQDPHRRAGQPGDDDRHECDRVHKHRGHEHLRLAEAVDEPALERGDQPGRRGERRRHRARRAERVRALLDEEHEREADDADGHPRRHRREDQRQHVRRAQDARVPLAH
jgi:hypothetical protein